MGKCCLAMGLLQESKNYLERAQEFFAKLRDHDGTFDRVIAAEFLEGGQD